MASRKDTQNNMNMHHLPRDVDSSHVAGAAINFSCTVSHVSYPTLNFSWAHLVAQAPACTRKKQRSRKRCSLLCKQMISYCRNPGHTCMLSYTRDDISCETARDASRSMFVQLIIPRVPKVRRGRASISRSWASDRVPDVCSRRAVPIVPRISWILQIRLPYTVKKTRPRATKRATYLGS